MKKVMTVVLAFALLSSFAFAQDKPHRQKEKTKKERAEKESKESTKKEAKEQSKEAKKESHQNHKVGKH